jgi:uncharacterized protein
VDQVNVLLLALGVLAGASSQRVTGLGFALVSAPLLVLAIGPFEGVLLSNLLGLITSVLVLATTWRHVEVGRALLLAAPALVLVPIGAVAVRVLPTAPLMMTVGATTVIALLAVCVSNRARCFRGRGGAIAAGGLSGFMNTTAGVGGPALVLYAASTKWDHRRFVPTCQLYLVIVNTASVAAKGFPRLSAVALLASLTALAGGVMVGHLLARRVSADRARIAMLVFALGGATTIIVKGALAW